jgi:RNA 3'-terminal phosphate cyclase (ATP)
MAMLSVRAFLPLIARMGGEVQLQLRSYGFYPRGGGEIVATITPSALSALTLTERGERVRAYAEAYVAALPIHIGQRELEVIGHRMNWSQDQLFLRGLSNDVGPGNAVTITVEYENVNEVFTGFGERGVRSEAVAAGAVDEARDYLASNAAVGEHLADQVLLPMAFGQGGSFTTSRVTEHLRSNAAIIETFTSKRVVIDEADGVFAVRL